MARKTTNTQKSPAAQKRRRAAGGFSNIRVEGELLPLELLSKIAVGDPSIEGLTSEDYGLFENQTINEKATEVWENLKQAWKKFRAQAKSLPKDASGAKATYDLWLKALLATGLGYQLRADEAPQTIGETAYPISHSAMFFAASGQKTVPVHIVSFRQDLDKRDPSCARSPMSLAQEYLNQRGGVLWGILTNGLRLRLLRENPSVARPAFVEFDLETIFDGDFYGDFSLFYLLCHASRLRPIDEAVSVGGAEPSGEDDDSAGDENGDDEGEDTEGAAGPAVVTSTCYLEKYRAAARIEGVRVYDTLRVGVREAIKHLGRGFLTHPDNDFIKQKFESGSLTLQDFYHELLRLVYRIIFLFIAEDRDLIFGPEVSKEKRLIYDKFYSMNRFRAMAPKVGGREKDLWIALRDIFRRFASGEERLGVPALGSTLFSPQFTPHLDEASLDNSSLMAAVWLLAYTDINGCRQSVNYKNLGTEELGSIYEALLEMRPHRDTGDFDLSDGVSGNERKTSGSYYTPPELVASLVESALVPVMEQRLRAAKTKKAQIEAILSMKVCDPTCGSGHFLLGAAHRMGHRLAQIRSGESSPTGEAYRQGVRDVIAHCIYGADINPMAVELCKVSLWIESMVPNKAMMFLDHRIRCGNTFLGAWRDLVKQGIPDGAYTPLEGDSKALCAQLKKANAGRRDGYRDLELEPDRQAEAESESPEALAAIDSAANETADDYETKSARYDVYLKGEKHRRDKDLFDLWSAAFLWPKKDDRDDPPTHDDLRGVQNKGIFNLTQNQRETLKTLREEYQFFHWELEFPEVFTPQRGGFDVVVGNPPWEKIKLQEKEFFAARDPEIAAAVNKDRRGKMINRLKAEDAPLYRDFLRAKRKSEALSVFVRTSGNFPLCGRGDINTYTLFAEENRRLIAPGGRVGCIVQSGIATDKTTSAFFQDLIQTNSLVSLYDFENRKGIFPSVHRSMKFALLSMAKSGAYDHQAHFSFFNLAVSDLETEGHTFTLSKNDFQILNPNTLTCPVFRQERDAELTKAIYRRVPILLREYSADAQGEGGNPWGVSFSTMFHMSNDSDKFRTRQQLEDLHGRLEGNRFIVPGAGGSRIIYLPLYEGKMIHQFNHRHSGFEIPPGKTTPEVITTKESRLSDPKMAARPRYWVEESDVEEKISASCVNKGIEVPKFLVGFRDITNVTNERTCIASAVPVTAVGHTLPLVFFSNISDEEKGIYFAEESSFCHDFAARQKVGGTHMTYNYYKQLPHLPPERLRPYTEEIVPHVLKLVYTSEEMRPFAESLGYKGEPFRWDPRERFELRCRLDALFFGLYLGFGGWSEATVAEETVDDIHRLTGYFPTPLDALDYIMGTFPIVKKNELKSEEKIAFAREICGEGYDPQKYYPSHAVIRKFYLDYGGNDPGN